MAGQYYQKPAIRSLLFHPLPEIFFLLSAVVPLYRCTVAPLSLPQIFICHLIFSCVNLVCNAPWKNLISLSNAPFEVMIAFVSHLYYVTDGTEVWSEEKINDKRQKIQVKKLTIQTNSQSSFLTSLLNPKLTFQTNDNYWNKNSLLSLWEIYWLR